MRWPWVARSTFEAVVGELGYLRGELSDAKADVRQLTDALLQRLSPPEGNPAPRATEVRIRPVRLPIDKQGAVLEAKSRELAEAAESIQEAMNVSG